VPDVDLQLEVELQHKLRAAIQARLLKSAHDCAEGGLAVALAECCIAGGSTGGAQWADPEAPRAGRAGRWLGAEVDLPSPSVVAGAAGRADLALFGEAPTRVIVTCAPDELEAVERAFAGLPHRVAGRVTGDHLRCTMDGEELVAVPVAELHSAYESLPQRLA
jgi:phosphoribosylformylglycinamidine synthase